MTELVGNPKFRGAARWTLLAGTSSLVLSAYMSIADAAIAGENDRPTVWIELGGELSRLNDGQQTFSPAIFASRPATLFSTTEFQKPPRMAVDGNVGLGFQPLSSDWSVSMSLRYGRSISAKHAHQQSYPGQRTFPSSFLGYPKAAVAALFADTRKHSSETHLILDFAVGKDVGLGLFGRQQDTSALSLGIRFAQFSSKSNVALRSDPDWHFTARYFTPYFKFFVQPYHSNAASIESEASFRGLGPSVSWKSSIPMVGDRQRSEIDFDWGINGALLFGRQKARMQHQTTQRYNTGGTVFTAAVAGGHGAPVTVYKNTPPVSVRSRSIVVPNIGGFGGLSFRYDAAKISFGYRADFFFGAMDGGIDAHEAYNRNFYGPYASVSIGLGG